MAIHFMIYGSKSWAPYALLFDRFVDPDRYVGLTVERPSIAMLYEKNNNNIFLIQIKKKYFTRNNAMKIRNL